MRRNDVIVARPVMTYDYECCDDYGKMRKELRLEFLLSRREALQYKGVPRMRCCSYEYASLFDETLRFRANKVMESKQMTVRTERSCSSQNCTSFT